MKYNFNVLETRAQELIAVGRVRDALRIFFFMADGDPSLDAGYLGKRIGECYESIGETYAAKYWFGRAVEEGSGAWPDSANARQRLEGLVTIDDLVTRDEYLAPDSDAGGHDDRR